MTAMTLVEAAKLETGDVYRAGVIEQYAGSSSILMNLPFMDIQGNAYKYNREGALPSIGFRGVNEGYTPSNGIINPITESLTIAGGEIDVDKFIVSTMGGSQRTVHEAMKIRSLGLAWTKKFIKGDTSNDPKEFDGLQTRVSGDQIISAGSTSGGAALSLLALDEAIDQTLNPTGIIMNKTMRRRLTQAARNTSVGGFISYEKDAFGRQVTMYNDLPILEIDLDNEQSEILGFSEAASSGSNTATSIYIVNMSEEGVAGIQNGGIGVQDLGELQSSPLYRTRIEWYSGLVALHGRSVTRLRNIGNLAVTA